MFSFFFFYRYDDDDGGGGVYSFSDRQRLFYKKNVTRARKWNWINEQGTSTSTVPSTRRQGYWTLTRLASNKTIFFLFFYITWCGNRRRSLVNYSSLWPLQSIIIYPQSCANNTLTHKVVSDDDEKARTKSEEKKITSSSIPRAIDVFLLNQKITFL